MQVNLVQNAGNYLGLQIDRGASKASLSGLLQERMESRTTSWKAKLLSTRVKDVLIKSIVQVFHSYVMCVFAT